MPDDTKRSVMLPGDQAAFVDSLVASGVYADAADVVGEGLRLMQERKAAIERWLREEVAPTYDRWKANPDDTLSSEDVAESMRRRHAERAKARA